MKQKYLLASLAALPLLLFQIPARADGDDDDGEFAQRLSLGADYKISKGLHASLSEEIRLSDFSFDKSVTSLGLSYKLTPWLKAAAGYDLIAADKEASKTINNVVYTQSYTDWRHRLSFDLTESWKSGPLKLSLRERIQMTHLTRPGLNTWEKPRNGAALRIRAKVSYDIKQAHLQPYASVEAKLTLNGASYADDALVGGDANKTIRRANAAAGYTGFEGYKDTYLSRIRAQAGLKYDITKQHGLDFFLAYDKLTDHDIQTYNSTEYTSKGVLKHIPGQLKSNETVKSNRFIIGAGYTFSF